MVRWVGRSLRPRGVGLWGVKCNENELFKTVKFFEIVSKNFFNQSFLHLYFLHQSRGGGGSDPPPLVGRGSAPLLVEGRATVSIPWSLITRQGMYFVVRLSADRVANASFSRWNLSFQDLVILNL